MMTDLINRTQGDDYISAYPAHSLSQPLSALTPPLGEVRRGQRRGDNIDVAAQLNEITRNERKLRRSGKMIKVTTSVFCDGCGIHLDVCQANKRPAIAAVRRKSRWDGWITIRPSRGCSEDYCPRCRKALENPLSQAAYDVIPASQDEAVSDVRADN